MGPSKPAFGWLNALLVKCFGSCACTRLIEEGVYNPLYSAAEKETGFKIIATRSVPSKSK